MDTNNSNEVSHNTIRNQQHNTDVLANIIKNTLNIICNVKNTTENMKNRIDKQQNKIPNLILAAITPHRKNQNISISSDPTCHSVAYDLVKIRLLKLEAEA